MEVEGQQPLAARLAGLPEVLPLGAPQARRAGEQPPPEPHRPALPGPDWLCTERTE